MKKTWIKGAVLSLALLSSTGCATHYVYSDPFAEMTYEEAASTRAEDIASAKETGKRSIAPWAGFGVLAALLGPAFFYPNANQDFGRAMMFGLGLFGVSFLVGFSDFAVASISSPEDRFRKLQLAKFGITGNQEQGAEQLIDRTSVESEASSLFISLLDHKSYDHSFVQLIRNSEYLSRKLAASIDRQVKISNDPNSLLGLAETFRIRYRLSEEARSTLDAVERGTWERFKGSQAQAQQERERPERERQLANRVAVSRLMSSRAAHLILVTDVNAMFTKYNGGTRIQSSEVLSSSVLDTWIGHYPWAFILGKVKVSSYSDYAPNHEAASYWTCIDTVLVKDGEAKGSLAAGMTCWEKGNQQTDVLAEKRGLAKSYDEQFWFFESKSAPNKER